MNESFTEVVFGLMYIVWMMALTALLLVTLPIWFVPYTVSKAWKYTKFIRGNRHE